MKQTTLIFAIFSLIGINILSATAATAEEMKDVAVLGWSKDGKVAVTEELDGGATGWRITRAFILNTVNDTVLWESRSATENLFGDAYDKAYSAFIDNFRRACRQQFGIEIQEMRLMVPSGPAFKHNGKTYNIAINSIKVEEGMVRRYSVTAETGGRMKTILSKDTFLPDLPRFSWCSISPFEERALIVIRWASFSHSYGFEYAGCHLAVGFR